VYISEAHPDDEWQMDSNREQKFVFKQPRSLEERRKLAAILVDRLKYRVPLAIDAIDNRADKAYAAWPERIYVIARGGAILYRGGLGPFGFHPEEAEKVLASLPKPAAPPAGGEGGPRP
jgi:hypothetical protein